MNDDNHWLPKSKYYKITKQLLEKVQKKLNEDKEISKDKKQNYSRVIRQMNYGINKVIDRWPAQIDTMMDNLNSILNQFDSQIVALSKGSSFFCGSGGSPKQLQNTFKRLAGYEHIFYIIRPFQDKIIKEQIITKYQQSQDKTYNSHKSSRKVNNQQYENKLPITSVQPIQLSKGNQKNLQQMCELMQAVSLCPNGFIAKKLIKQLPDTQWIAGILHEQGTIVDKDLDKAIIYYKQAISKKNYEALYRLGSLNERGLYGQPYQYIKMWEQASANGHLEAMTDMGYLYQYGLENEDGDKTILQPNFQKAYNYYKKAAEKNFPRALNNLATFFFSNQKYHNESKCLQYLQRAAEAQYVKSLHNLGLIYYQGKIVKLDEIKSKNLIRRAAQKGDIQGRIMYIQILLNDVQSCSEDQLLQINKYCREIIAKDDQNSEAYYFLGIMYEQGYGVQKQPKTAFLYYTIAASMKNEASYMKLGQCYKNGFGTEQDLRQAVRYIQLSAQHNKEALVILGQIYEKGGQDLNQNYKKAFDYYYEACNYGISDAYSHLGNMYKYGRHATKNQSKAEQYFQKAKNYEKNNHNRKLNSSNSDLIQSSYYRRR